MTNAESNKPNNPPDLRTAVKQLWDVVKAKAKEVGQKATEAAKDLKAKTQTSQVIATQPGVSTSTPQTTDIGGQATPANPASSAAPLKSRAVLGCLGLVACLLVCGGILSLFGVGGSKDGQNRLSSYEDTPPFVAEHVKKGCLVYELQSWQFSDVTEKSPETLYAVIDGDKLSRVYMKSTRTYAKDGHSKPGPSWFELTRFTSSPISLAYRHEGKRLESVKDFKTGNIQTKIALQVDLQFDKSSDNGKWEGTVTRDEKDTSSQPRFPDQHKVTEIRGDLIVHGNEQGKPRTAQSGSGSGKASSKVADLRQQLLDTAKRMDGDFVEVVADIVDAVESGDQPWSVADKRMHEFRPGHHQFARETISAYEKWKAARISAERK